MWAIKASEWDELDPFSPPFLSISLSPLFPCMLLLGSILSAIQNSPL